MRTFLRSKVTLLFLTLAVLLAVPAIAFATDTLSPDADTVNTGIQPVRNLGNVAAGATLTPTVDFYLVCGNGGGQARHFDSTDSATLTFDKPNSAIPAGGDLSAGNATIAGPNSPTNWPADDVNCGTPAPAPVKVGTSAVTIQAPSTSGNHNYTVRYNVGRASSTDVTELSTPVVVANFVLTVQQQSQTITFNQPAAKTYGDADFDPGATASSNLQVSYNSDTPSVCTIVSGKVHIVSAGDCKVTASQAGNANYSAAPSVQRTIVINKAPLSAEANNASREYGEANPAFSGTLTGVKNNDAISASYSSAATASSDVGTYNIVPSINATAAVLANYQTPVLTNGTLTVTQAPLTIKADNASREYGEANPAFTGSIVNAASTVKNNDALSVSASSSATAASNVGTYNIVPALNGANAGNYEVTAQNGTLTVTAAPLSAEANNASREYGDPNPTFTGTLTGVKNSDAISASYSSAATASSDVGTYNIVPSINATAAVLANYQTPVLTNGTLTVTQAPLTIKADNASREYGDPNPTFSGSIVNAASTVKNNDALSVSASSSATAASNVGTYNIVPALNGANAGNYEVTAQNGTLTVTAAPLSAEADNASREYGDPNPTFSGTLTGVKNNDAISASYSSAATASSNVGTYNIVPSLNATAAVLANYQDPVLTNGTLTVTAAPLSAEANNASREYGDPNPTFTGTLTGVKNSDAISASYSSAATASSDVGTYNIVPSINATAAVLANYQTPVLTNGTLTVTQAPLTIKADNASRYYNEPNPTFSGSIVNAASTVKNNDALSVSASSSATQSTLPGTYAIVPALNGANAGNYEVTAQNGTLTIKSWTTAGFYQPVDMNGVYNTVKGGSTVPLKFELFSGTTELTDTASIKSLQSQKITCAGTALEDAIEAVATGGTSLRYDTTGGQFIYNWKTPTGAGSCYKVTVTANDGSTISALFKMK